MPHLNQDTARCKIAEETLCLTEITEGKCGFWEGGAMTRSVPRRSTCVWTGIWGHPREAGPKGPCRSCKGLRIEGNL